LATIRVEKRKDFTVLSNACFDDERLSLKAVGLLGYMLRLPDDWNFTLEWLAGKHKDGLASIRSAMEELESAGYVTRGQSRQGGKFSKNEYIVRESPEKTDTSSGALRHLPLKGKADEEDSPPLCENRMTVPPLCDFPITEKPITENRTLLKTEIPSTTPPKAPRRGRREKAACEWEPEMFERFWALYPRGEDKAAARYEWDLLKPDHELMQRMSAALKRQMQSDEWRRGVGIPYACRWLSKRRWEADEKLVPVPGSNTGGWADAPEVS
jgi:hypothetical protein